MGVSIVMAGTQARWMVYVMENPNATWIQELGYSHGFRKPMGGNPQMGMGPVTDMNDITRVMGQLSTAGKIMEGWNDEI